MREETIAIYSTYWSFSIDPTRKHNLIDPCLLDFFRDVNEPVLCDHIISDEERAKLIETDPFSPLLPFPELHEIYKPLRAKFVKNSKGRWRRLRGVLLNFQHEDKEYSEVFYIDKSLCSAPLLGGCKIVGIWNYK